MTVTDTAYPQRFAGRIDANVMRVDALLDALEVFATVTGGTCSRDQARRSLAAVVASDEGGSWDDHLVEAARVLGVATKRFSVRAPDLRADTFSRCAPCVVGGLDGQVIVVLGVAGKTLEIADGRSLDRSRKVSFDALLALLGTGSDRDVVVISGETMTPLDALRLPEGGASPGRRLRALLVLERDDLWVAVIYAIAVGLLSLATPLAVQTLVNTVAFGALAQPLVVLTLLVFAGLAFAGVLRALQAWVVERVQQRIFVRVAIDLAHRLPRMTLDARRTQHGPELLNRFFDVVTMQKGAAALLVDGVAIVLQTVLGMVLLGFYHPLLLAFAGVLTACIAIVVLVFGRGGTKTAMKESTAKYAVGAWLQEVARHEVAFASAHGAAFAVHRVEALTRDWIALRRKHFTIVFRQAAGALVLQAVASAVLLGVGGGLVLARQLTLGQLVAAELIVSAVVAGFSKMGKYLEDYYDLVAAIDKVGNVIDTPIEPADGAGLPLRTSPLDVKVIDGTLVDARGGIVRDGVSLSVAGGTAALLVARSQRVRTALADLLGLQGTPIRGRVEIDGQDSRVLSPALARKDIALVRRPEVFAGTVADNVSAGRPASSAELREALELAGAWEEIARLPEGVATDLVSDDRRLSRELAVRLTLARALLGGPRLLVVDGAFDDLPASSRCALVSRLMRSRPMTLAVLTAEGGWQPESVVMTVVEEPS